MMLSGMSLKLRTRHGCVEVKILGVDGHEPHTGGGDNAVEEEFGGKHVCCGCAAVTRKVDAIAAYSEVNMVGVLFSGRKLATILPYVMLHRRSEGMSDLVMNTKVLVPVIVPGSPCASRPSSLP